MTPTLEVVVQDPSSIPLWGSLLNLRRGFLGDESGDSRDFDEN